MEDLTWVLFGTFMSPEAGLAEGGKPYMCVNTNEPPLHREEGNGPTDCLCIGRKRNMGVSHQRIATLFLQKAGTSGPLCLQLGS